MEFFIVLILVFIGFSVAEGSQEIVLVQDTNSDHDRRHLDAGLPSTLKFDLKRESGTVQLTLEENERLNANAPVYEVHGISEEERKLVKQDSVPITNVRFYQDKGKSGAFTVRCQMAVDGPCIRYLIGNLYIGERNYDIEPVPDIESKRKLNVEGFGTPHYLTENERAQNFHPDMIRSLEIADLVEATDTEGPTVDNKVNIEEDLDTIDETEPIRQKRGIELFAVEILVVLDYSVWIKYYDATSATETLNKTEATKLKLREHYSHIINGVSLRYESIDDPKLSIYCTISGFLILKKRDGTNPLRPGREKTFNDRTYAEANEYLNSLVRWVKTLKDPPLNDHIMTFTLYDLYSGSVDKNAVEGVAFMEGICGPYRVSLNEEEDIFSTISVAAHELGHNLGADHDKKSDPCDLHGDFLMAPYVALFNDSSKYSVNPWRFSQCSINAFKKLFGRLGSKNCLTDPGDYYNHKEYVQHNRKLPGELHDATAQCKLLLGEKSRLCTSQNQNKICMVMKCLTPRGKCRYFAAARGTSCGAVGSQKWCINGACTRKDFYVKPDIYFEATTSSITSTTELASTSTSSTTAIISTTESTIPTYLTTESSTLSKRSVVSTTMFQSTDPKCVDIGLFDNTYTCSEIQRYYASDMEFCSLWEVECCDTCKNRVPCTDHGYYGYSCEAILEWYEFYIDLFCEDFGTMCCATCQAGGMTTFYTTTTVASTTPIGTELFQCRGDVGYDGLTCKQLETIHGNKYEMCMFYTAECCRTCAERCKGNKNIQLYGESYRSTKKKVSNLVTGRFV